MHWDLQDRLDKAPAELISFFPLIPLLGPNSSLGGLKMVLGMPGSREMGSVEKHLVHLKKMGEESCVGISCITAIRKLGLIFRWNRNTLP